MSAILKDNPVKKQEYILSLAASGKSSREIAEELGYKDVHSLHTFMRRRDMVWSAKKNIYLIRGQDEETEKTAEAELPAGKAGRIIAMFAKKVDSKEIAKQLRFGSIQEMADYMKSKGYLWDNKQGNYIKTVLEVKNEPIKEPGQQLEDRHGNDFMGEYGGILKLLKDNESRLLELLAVSAESTDIPRYAISGYSITKSMDIPNSLDQLVKDFSRDKGIPQKEILKAALIEFMKKYGYASEVKEVLHV